MDSDNSIPGERRRRRPIVVASWSVALAVAMVGCGEPDPPDPLATAVVESRTASASELTQAVDEVATSIGGEILGRSSVDECYAGQRNYKVDTGYNHRCSLVVGALVGTDGDFRSTMADVDRSLRDLGWDTYEGEWPGQLVNRYWELRAGEDPDGRVAISRLPGPNTLYRDDLRMRFAYGDSESIRGLDAIDGRQRVTLWCCGLPFHEDRQLIDLDQVVRSTKHEHLVFITVEGHYLER
jgi:hypothetical protein